MFHFTRFRSHATLRPTNTVGTSLDFTLIKRSLNSNFFALTMSDIHRIEISMHLCKLFCNWTHSDINNYNTCFARSLNLIQSSILSVNKFWDLKFTIQASIFGRRKILLNTHDNKRKMLKKFLSLKIFQRYGYKP